MYGQPYLNHEVGTVGQKKSITFRIEVTLRTCFKFIKKHLI